MHACGRRWQRYSCRAAAAATTSLVVAGSAFVPTAACQAIVPQRHLRGQTQKGQNNEQPTALIVGILQMVAQDGSPSDAFPLFQCQGHCDVDTDCLSGLVCYQREGNNNVPGCIGRASESVEFVSYCVDPRHVSDDPFAGVTNELSSPEVSTITPDGVVSISTTTTDTNAPTDVPSKQSSISLMASYPSPFSTASLTSAPSVETTTSSCSVCTNVSPDKNQSCPEINFDDNRKCIYDDNWAAERFCQYSCYVANQSYSSDIICCQTLEPMAARSKMPSTGMPSRSSGQAPTTLPTSHEPSHSPIIGLTTRATILAPTYEPSRLPTSKITRMTCDTRRLSTESTDVIFPIRSSFDGRTFPCYDSESSNDLVRGVFYVKIPKTDSSYWRAVGVRTIHRMETSVFNNGKCSFLGGHNTALSLNLKDRVSEQSFAYTFIRNPREWAVKRFYFRKSVSGGSIGADAMMQYLQRDKNRNGQAKYIAQHDFRNYADMSNPVAAAKEIVASYDFIGLVEEPAKSLVVMQLLLGLDMFDILYHQSPLAGTITYFRDDSDKCGRVIDQSPPQEVKDYLDSTVWYRDNAVEVEIYAEVKKSIEATIDRLGRDRFDEALCDHKALMKEFQSFADNQCIIRCEYELAYILWPHKFFHYECC